MFTQRKMNGAPVAESLAHAQRVIGEVMKDLSRHPQWRDPFQRVTVQAAVNRCVSFMIGAGETNDEVMKVRTLQIVMRDAGDQPPYPL